MTPVQEKLLVYLAKIAAMGEQLDGTRDFDKHKHRKLEERLRNGINKCAKKKDFKADISIKDENIWSSFMTHTIPAHFKEYLGVDLPEERVYVCIYFNFTLGFKHWRGAGKKKSSLTGIDAKVIYTDTGEFVGFTKDCLYSTALDTFCRNVFGKGSV